MSIKSDLIEYVPTAIMLASTVFGLFMKLRLLENKILSRFLGIETSLKEIKISLQVEQARLTDTEFFLEKKFDDFYRRQYPDILSNRSQRQ